MIKKIHHSIKNFDIKNLSFEQFKYPAIVIAVMGIVFAIFTQSIKPFLGLFIGFVIIVYIPGFALASLLLKEWSSVEKSVIALFLGMGPGPVIVYALSFLNIHALTIGFSIFLAIIGIIVILFSNQEKSE